MKFRHELKHRVNELDLTMLRKRLEAVMTRDKNCRSDGTYFIKSLYFDTYADKALRQKLNGVDKREKFRIRYYNDDISFIRLEKKSKINGMCLKENAQITAGQVMNILEGNTEFLIQSEIPLFHELYAKMKFELLRPKSVVAYEREGFVHPCGNVRVTLDSSIRGSNNTHAFLNDNAVLTRLYHTSILEVKWDEYLPQIIADAVQLGSRNSAAFSKYAAVRF